MGSLRAADADADANAAARSSAAREDAWHVMRLGMLVGGVIASLLTTLTALRPAALIAGLTTDVAVREACGSIVLPVLVCQLFKGLAFPSNGVVMGGLDWGFATAGVWCGSALCVGLVHAFAGPPTLYSVWIGLSAFMGSQTVLSVARVLSGKGPWRLLYPANGTGRSSR